MKIAIGNGTAVGKNSIALGDETDARTFEVEENRNFGIEDLNYDYSNDVFVPNEVGATFQEPPPRQSTSPTPPLPFQGTNTEASLANKAQKKRNIIEFEGNNNSIETTTRVNGLEKLSASIDSIATDFRGIRSLLEKKERDSSCWDAIKEIPNLDNQARYKAVELLNTKSKKDMFLKMTPEERSDWITYKLLE